MDTLAEVLARARSRDGVAFEAPGRRTPTSHAEFATSAWKTGNLLRHYGVRPGSRVALVVGPKDPASGAAPGRLGAAPDPLFGLLGAAAAGATVTLAPESPVEGRALVAPQQWLEGYEVGPGCSVLVYGGPPERPEVAHFERERWSENPTEPPGAVAPEDPVFRVEDREYTHETLIETANGVIRDHGLDAGDTVAIEAGLDHPGTVVAGVVAPLVVGATIRPDSPGEGVESDARYTVRTPSDGDTGGGNSGYGVVDPSTVIG